MKAIGSILLFIATYFLLICFAIGSTVACAILGYTLFAYYMSGYTAMLALGLVSMGILILIFLVKFIFKKHVTDLTHLTEITRDQEPQLFLMIEEIVSEVKTDFPKKIYLSADVNAAVFYDSSFWSMFLPVKKNLQIGLGLVNSVSVIELRAILAHEFGHFSQRSMKVGSYVYNMNQIIYNMLYDNEGYDALAQKWADGSTYLAIFVGLAVKIIRGIQWILQKVYNIINLSYMSLSREMEFHADEVAANVTGSLPLITSLLRMELAEQSYQAVLNYYEGKISEAEKAQNIYPQQSYVMNFLAEKNNLPLDNNLPQVTLDHLNRYNKSKLVVKNQWASHPTTEDRVRRLEKLNLEIQNNDSKPASELFKNIEVLQNQLTEKIFAAISYSSPEVVKSKDQFIEAFVADHLQNSFDQVYNTYYDNKNPLVMDIENIPETSDQSMLTLSDLFGDEALDNVYEFISLDSDINTLRQIQEGHYLVKSFDYDGTKYTPADSEVLIASLQSKSQEMKAKILINDVKIYQYFSQLAAKMGSESYLKSLYQKFFRIDIAIDDRFKVYSEMVDKTGFIFQTTPFEMIKKNLIILKEVEIDFKKEIKYILEEDAFKDHISEEISAKFNEYLSGDYTFFHDQEYKSDELGTLFSAINNYQTVMSKTYFGVKKQLLDYQVTLIGSFAPFTSIQ